MLTHDKTVVLKSKEIRANISFLLLLFCGGTPQKQIRLCLFLTKTSDFLSLSLSLCQSRLTKLGSQLIIQCAVTVTFSLSTQSVELRNRHDNAGYTKTAIILE
jgi:hypothetical protein